MAKPRVLTINLSCDEIVRCYHSLAGRYRFHFALKPEEAAAVAPRFKPDIMVYEIDTPNEAEIRTFVTMRSAISGHVPVISIAAENSLEIEESVRRTGIYHYLVKPYAMQELTELLHAAAAYSFKGRT